MTDAEGAWSDSDVKEWERAQDEAWAGSRLGPPPRLRSVATVEIEGVEGMRSLLGQEVGPSEWRTVSQDDINTFAELSRDDQWIHVDVERAKSESPYATTIAHGNLTLAMVDGFRTELISSTGFALGVNYGWKASA